MSKQFYFVTNAESRKGIGDLLKSQEVQDMLLQRAQSVANNAGKGYKARVSVGKTRAESYAQTNSFASRADNLKNNSLLKALYNAD